MILDEYYATNDNYIHSRNSMIRLSIGYCIMLLLFTILTFVFSSELISIVAGKVVIQLINILKILSFTILFAIGSFYSVLLVIKSEGKTLSKITLITMVANLILVLPSIYFFGIYGLACQFVLVQILHSILQIKYNYEIWK